MWNDLLAPVTQTEAYSNLCDYIREQRKTKIVYPMDWQIFKAIEHCSPSMVKVVILGKEPYYQPGSSNLGICDGLAYSTDAHFKDYPTGLKNILRALKVDLGITRSNGNLKGWATQGVLLLNTVLTVEKGKPNSHVNKGWQKVTDRIIEMLGISEYPIVWMLWGKEMQEKQHLLGHNPNHLIIETASPSASTVSEGFLWERQFSRANKFLEQKNQVPINWRL